VSVKALALGLPNHAWRTITWREGSGAPLRSRFARVRVRIAPSSGADGRDHVRTFLVEALEELGFVTCECRHARELASVLDARKPDLVILGLSTGAVEAGEILRILAARRFDGKVLLHGAPACPAMAAIQELAEELEIAMLPKLDTPFSEAGLRNSVAVLQRSSPSNWGRMIPLFVSMKP
jgi:CheY-like chemotaxis protein